MTPDDIRNVIKTRFAHLQIESFEYLTVVGEDFFTANVEKFDFKNLKHLWKTGPVYIRTFSPIPSPLDDNDISETEGRDSEDNDLQDIDIDTPSNLTNTNSIVPGTNPTNTHSSGSYTLWSCPMCLKNFPLGEIESHASTCEGSIDPYDHFMNTSSDDKSRIIPFETKEKRSVSDIIWDLKLGVGGQLEPTEKLKVRRSRCWDDFVDKLKKPWFTGKRHLFVTFLGESGVDDGGLCREFFTGKLL